MNEKSIYYLLWNIYSNITLLIFNIMDENVFITIELFKNHIVMGKLRKKGVTLKFGL